MRRRKSTLAAAVGLAVLAVAGLRGRVRRYAIAEGSMSPALEEGNWTLATKIRGRPHRGAVVVFEHPTNPDMELVKRIVGLPGETIVIANGQVHVDGSVLAEPWADGPTLPDGEWNLGDDDVFVLGDARSISGADSRNIGPLPMSAVEWQISARYWPPTAIGRVPGS